MSRARNFVFTVNNYEQPDIHFYREIFFQERQLQFLCFGREIAPTTGTRHMQGYFQCRSPVSSSALLHWIRSRDGRVDFLAIAKGSGKQNVDYCSKESDDDRPFFSIGTMRGDGQGRRTDLDLVVDCVNEGKSFTEIAELHGTAVIKYGGGIQRLQALRTPKRCEPTEIYWYWGPTGSGKSRAAWEEFPEAYSKDPSNKWWDGYTGQDCVILDDYRPSKEIPFNQLLRLGDRYPLTVECKGAFINFAPKVLIITTPKDPRATFESLEWIGPEQLDQLERRITKCIKYGDQLAIDNMFRK